MGGARRTVHSHATVANHFIGRVCQPRIPRLRCFIYTRAQVRDSWIAGERRLADGELVDFDSVGLLERVQRWRATIASVRSPA